MRLHLAALGLVLIAGCSGGARSTGDTAKAASPAPVADAQPAAAPHEIALTNQKVAWECPVCEMDYDGPGRCAMGCGELVRMDVAYECAADHQPVPAAGRCPRCNQPVKIVKTAFLGVAGASAEPPKGFAN